MTDESIDLYWRPGCGFCMALEHGLSKFDIAITRHNIWEDPGAAEFVRSAANGNETVPTVNVGGSILVNPTARQVLATMQEHAPELLPEGYEPPEQGRVSKLVNRVLGG